MTEIYMAPMELHVQAKRKEQATGTQCMTCMHCAALHSTGPKKATAAAKKTVYNVFVESHQVPAAARSAGR